MLEGSVTLSEGSYGVSVGAGGAHARLGANGGPSSFAQVTALGGGAGGGSGRASGNSGGSGGGTTQGNSSPGQGAAGPPRQGHNGGRSNNRERGGGGGGAGGPGQANLVGGPGKASSILPAAIATAQSVGHVVSGQVFFAGGGGGVRGGTSWSPAGAAVGGGGAGAKHTATAGQGRDHTGGGGGSSSKGNGGRGGHGVVVVRYKAARLAEIPGLAGKFFNGSWRSTISTGNIGTLPLTSQNNSSNVTGTSGLPSAAHRYGVNLWPSINYGNGIGDNYGFIAVGYFRAPASGTYTFWTASDDGSGVWVGDLALPGRTRTAANATLNNNLGGGQGVTERSGTAQLSAGQVYPVRIVHEEGGGDDALRFSWAGPGFSKREDLTTHFFTPYENGFPTGDYSFARYH